MSRIILLSVACATAFVTMASTVNAVPLTPHTQNDETLEQAEKLERLKAERRRTPQQCLVLGFITDQLECSTCEAIKTDLVEDGVTSLPSSYDDKDIYYQCLSCCSRDKLAGDALRIPTSTAHEEGKEERSSQSSQGKRKKAALEKNIELGDKAKSEVPPPLPYVLPPSPSYWRARCEISMMQFEQNHDWYKLVEKVDGLFPMTDKDIEKDRTLTAHLAPPSSSHNKKSSTVGKGKSGGENPIDSEADPSLPKALVEVFPVYQHRSVIYLYSDTQIVPMGPPDRLTRKGDEAIMFLELSGSSGWDANKVEEFLNHTIKGSVKRLELAEKEEELKKKSQKEGGESAGGSESTTTKRSRSPSASLEGEL